jgi:K+/H+ antiporter YhaU regulatory subunit KhtT
MKPPYYRYTVEKRGYLVSIYISFLFFALILLIIELATLLLQSTGLSREVARFQAISLLTGTGFTTSEAELITKHPLRRKIGEVLILFGTLAFATVIAILINFIHAEFTLGQLLKGILLLTSLFALFRIRRFQSFILNRMKPTMVHASTLEEVFHLEEDDIVLEIILKEQHVHLFKSLRLLNLATDYGIHILTIQRKKENTDFLQNYLIKYPTGSTSLRLGDILVVFGKRSQIKAIFGSECLELKQD